MQDRGSIIAEAAYAQGKMLDHSGWAGQLARNITPSDRDFNIDANGRIIFGEASSNYESWDEVSIGQRRFYENCIRGTEHCAVLCRHRVPTMQQVNTYSAFESFQVMVWSNGFVIGRIDRSVIRWQRFVKIWVNRPDGPLRMRELIIRQAAQAAINGGFVSEFVMGRK